MKKILSIFAGFLILLSFSACSQLENREDSSIASGEWTVIATDVREEELAGKQQAGQSIEQIEEYGQSDLEENKEENGQVGQSIAAQTTGQNGKQSDSISEQNQTEAIPQQSTSAQDKTEGNSQQSTAAQSKTEATPQQSASIQNAIETSTEGISKQEGKAKEAVYESSTAQGKGAAQASLYIGEYKDYEVNEPNLQIQQNGDGTFFIQIGIHKIASMYDGRGTLTEKGMEFTITAPNDEKLTGIITLEKEVATVTFTNQVWAEYSTTRNSFDYYKTSDTPNIYLPDYMDLEADIDPFVGEYNDYDVDEPSLEIQKNEDGTYLIQIGIFRLTTLDNCIGIARDGRLEFSTKLDVEAGEEAPVINGTITLEGDVATVTFEKPFWFAEQNIYKYHKTSHIPHIYTPY